MCTFDLNLLIHFPYLNFCFKTFFNIDNEMLYTYKCLAINVIYLEYFNKYSEINSKLY